MIVEFDQIIVVHIIFLNFCSIITKPKEYGMTEAGVTNIEHPTCFCPGSVGPVMDGHKVVVKKFNESQHDGEVSNLTAYDLFCCVKLQFMSIQKLLRNALYSLFTLDLIRGKNPVHGLCS